MKKFKSLLLAAAFFVIPFAGHAWGALGHRIVGEIAYSYLTKHTKKEIEKILGFESVAMASTWGDFIRSDAEYKYTTTWHYVNLPSGISHEAMLNYFAADTVTDAYTKVSFMIRELKTNKLVTQDMKVFYLRMIIHIMGDLSQPMHVAHSDDSGGNAVKVTWFKEPSNLHQIWDEKLIEFQQLSYTEYAAAINHTTKAQRDSLQSQSLPEAIWDTYTITEKVYADIKPNDNLSYGYNFKFVNTLNNQLVKGGVRLAGVLNDIFK